MFQTSTLLNFDDNAILSKKFLVSEIFVEELSSLVRTMFKGIYTQSQTQLNSSKTNIFGLLCIKRISF